jgi:hypothetical protein
MKFTPKTIALSLLLATGPFAGAAFAMAPATSAAPAVSPVKEYMAQLKSDEAALFAKERQWKADEAKLKADSAAGRMVAQSPDAQRVYEDRQAIKGERKDIAADRPGSLQLKADKLALRGEEKQLAADRARLRADRLDGKMAAQSKDSEKAYDDLQFIHGEKKDIAADRVELKKARKG